MVLVHVQDEVGNMSAIIHQNKLAFWLEMRPQNNFKPASRTTWWWRIYIIFYEIRVFDSFKIVDTFPVGSFFMIVITLSLGAMSCTPVEKEQQQVINMPWIDRTSFSLNAGSYKNYLVLFGTEKNFVKWSCTGSTIRERQRLPIYIHFQF